MLAKQKIRNTNKMTEGSIFCDPGYHYWIVLDNPSLFVGSRVEILYTFELGYPSHGGLLVAATAYSKCIPDVLDFYLNAHLTAYIREKFHKQLF